MKTETENFDWFRISRSDSLPLIKMAQIWTYDASDDVDGNNQRQFGSLIKEAYELEYKYSMMKNRPFNGNTRRQENMIKKLEERLNELLPEILTQIIKTFEKWLEYHALTSPDTWSAKRVEQEANFARDEGSELSGQNIDSLLSEYLRYSSGDGKYVEITPAILNRAWHTMMNEVFRNLNSFPIFKEWLSSMYLPDYKEMLKQDANYDGLENFNQSWGKEFQDIGEAEDFIDTLTLENVDLDSSVIAEDGDSFIKSLNNSGRGEDVLRELYRYFVFPVWHRYWKSQGIERTRKTVEKIFKTMQDSMVQGIEKMVAAMSLGLNAAHQTGDMLDYLEQDTYEDNLKSDLDWATEGMFIEEANKQLKEVGVVI